MTKTVERKLKNLPAQPGVYFHKDDSGEIIYVGKAANLRNRVRQYFQKSHSLDPKTELLVGEIADLDWQVVDSELDALFLEAELIRRYLPRYNILLRDDKSMVYVRIDYDSNYPTVSLTRRPLDDKARYFGPYLSAYSVRMALKQLRKIFPYATREVRGQKRASLHYHLGLDPGLEEGKTSLKDYRANLRRLMAVMEGKRNSIEQELTHDMYKAAKAKDFEMAAKIRNQLYALQNLSKKVIFSDKEFLDLTKDHALSELAELLGLYAELPQQLPAIGAQSESGQHAKTYNVYHKETAEAAPQQSAATAANATQSVSRQAGRLRLLRRIEGYDISHMGGANVVASMVVFTNGVSNKSEYRKFKTYQNRNDDFANMYETLTRRLSERNIKKWGLPDLVLIDGGKGQLEAAIKARDDLSSVALAKGRAGYSHIPFVGLAKRQEQIVIKKPTTTQNTTLGGPSSEHKNQNYSGSSVQLNEQVLHKLNGFAESSDKFILVNLPPNTNMVKLLQRIRDESHRFAVSYHSTLKRRQQTASLLDEIPGIGPATRKKLVRLFGSVRGVRQARQWELEKVLGEKKATILRQYLRIL